MFENIINFFKKLGKKEKKESSNTAKERLHLVLMQDRANVSADFLELMRQEIIEVIKKYIDIDEKAIDVKLTNKTNEDGTVGAPALYANIPIITIKNDARKLNIVKQEESKQLPSKKEEKQEAKNNNITSQNSDVEDNKNKEANEDKNEVKKDFDNSKDNDELKSEENENKSSEESKTKEATMKLENSNVEDISKNETAQTENSSLQDVDQNKETQSSNMEETTKEGVQKQEIEQTEEGSNNQDTQANS